MIQIQGLGPDNALRPGGLVLATASLCILGQRKGTSLVHVFEPCFYWMLQCICEVGSSPELGLLYCLWTQQS